MNRRNEVNEGGAVERASGLAGSPCFELDGVRAQRSLIAPHRESVRDELNPSFHANKKSLSGPVSRVLSRAIIFLGGQLPGLSSSLPEGITGRTSPCRGEPRLPSAWPCSGWGLPCRSSRLEPRCALTAPFHPYLILESNLAVYFLLH